MPLTATLMLVMLATVLVLISGIVLMAIGGKFNKKYANKLMTARIVLQAAALLVLGIFYFLHHPMP